MAEYAIPKFAMTQDYIELKELEKQQMQEGPSNLPPFFLKTGDKDSHVKGALPVPGERKHFLMRSHSQENSAQTDLVKNNSYLP